MERLTQPGEEVGAPPRVSVVLPVFNSAKELPASLSELDKQSFTDREIIVVDDGSTDETWGEAKELSEGRTDIVLVRTEHRGPSHARNAGLQKARGDIVFFSESDCVYDRDYLERAVGALDSDATAAAVCLTGAPLITRSTLATRSIDIENKVQHRLLEQGKIEPFYAWVFRREAISKLGGFDERLFQGEDKDVFRRLKDAKYTVAWVPGVNWRHIRDQTTSELARKWYTRGKTRVLYLLKYRKAGETAKGLAPLWATIVGFAVLPFSPIIGAALLVLVAATFLYRTLRVMSISWGSVDSKRSYLGYPLFLLVRNFSTSLGYSAAMLTVVPRKLQGKEVGWEQL